MKLTVSKEIIDVISQLGVPYQSNIKKVGLQKAAFETLKRYNSGKLNSAYSKFIEEEYSYIEAIAGTPNLEIRYKFATIYKDAITGLMEIEEYK